MSLTGLLVGVADHALCVPDDGPRLLGREASGSLEGRRLVDERTKLIRSRIDVAPPTELIRVRNLRAGQRCTSRIDRISEPAGFGVSVCAFIVIERSGEPDLSIS
ncbi:hypothetical protein [Micromonospora sp. CB01531]|uniref:hypothetical protein n=1 Tax=Micromonospora sp. CB01531 TaxID=1718947 RepID=UPI000A80D48A|nr:hypothetical protein [Micromonospora sp. CB01531]